MLFNIAIIALVSFVFGLIYALSYFSRNMGFGGGRYYYNTGYNRPRRSGMGPILFIFMVTIIVFALFFKYNARSDTEEAKGWTDDLPSYSAVEKKKPEPSSPDLDHLRDNTQRVNHEQENSQKVNAASALGMLELELDRRAKQPRKVEVIQPAHYRLQLIAGPSETAARKYAQEQQAKLGVPIYVMLDLDAPSQAYKVMAGDFQAHDSADRFKRNAGVVGIVKDLRTRNYELIANY